MKKAILFNCLLFVCFNFFAQKDVNVPETNSFNSGAGGESSINQSNGKLSINLSLLSLKGFKDLSASFSIGYDGGNVSKTANTSSEYAPTGVLGLGWGMQFSRIVVDNKLTAARDDDTFYLLDGGLNKLIATDKTSTTITFKSEMHKPWIIKYYPNGELWEITKENGYKYTYGNIDWVVYWDNWIGNSNQTNASRQGSSWNLTEVEDLYGNKVTYQYDNIEQSLKNTGVIKHTEATYLDKIIGPCGEEIRFTYSTKSSSEYFEPNTNQSEPDAYQEVYDKKFLDRVRAYDSQGSLLNEYDFNYSFIGSGVKRKRLLTEILLKSASNEQQTFREFEYETSTLSPFYGQMKHQILPTKGRISYQYQVNEIPVDQIYNTSASDNTTFFVQEDYILKLTGTNQLYLLTWTGSTWEEELFHSMSSGGVQTIDGKQYKSMHVVARKDFFVVVHPGSPDRVLLSGRENNGKTWKKSWLPFHHPGVSNFLELKVIGGNDFVAIGNPAQDRINFYRWDGAFWITESLYPNTNGNFFYTGTNNYVLQHREKGGADIVKLFYYDIVGNLQVKNINSGLETSGGAISSISYWHAQNSFALVNANQSPEYAIRWNKNYDYIGKEQPYDDTNDDIDTYGLFNSYFAIAKSNDNPWFPSSTSTFTRYRGNGSWIRKTTTSAPFIEDVNTTGFGSDVIVHPSNAFNGPNTIHRFNANTGSWTLSNYSSGSSIRNQDKRSFDVFANRYVFANRTLYRVNQNLSVSSLGNQPDNTTFSTSDGGNLLYLSSRGGGTSSGSAFAKVLSMTREGTTQSYNITSNYYLHENKYRNFPSHAMAYGTFVVRQNGGSTAKIYKMIDGKLTTNTLGQTVYKDVVIAKETFDPVLTRKQRNFYCYTNPHPSKDNMRVNYQYVSQFNDIDAILGKTVTTHDIGATDERMIGLPTKIRIYDAEETLVSEQINSWKVNDIAETYYINMTSKVNHSYEGAQKITSEEKFFYDFNTGLLEEKRIDDSEGNTEISRNTYLHEVYPQALDYNLISPVAYQEQLMVREDETEVYKNASAVKWDFSTTPRPGSSYAWNGSGNAPPTFNFNSTSHPGYRAAQEVDRVDGYGNIIEESNRSSVTTSYLYGYQGKRMVAKIEGATFDQAAAAVNMSIINNPSSEAALEGQLDALRTNLPDAFITTYTYVPTVGLSTQTDVRGRTTRYVYDSFFRLDHVKNEEGNILKKSSYHYREAPFNYSTESTSLPDCGTTGEANTDPNDEPPLTLSLVKVSESPSELNLRVDASDGGSYTYDWFYTTISGNVNDFPYTTSGRYLYSDNPDCNDGVLSVKVSVNTVDAFGDPITVQSNIVNHTYSSSPECNQQ